MNKQKSRNRERTDMGSMKKQAILECKGRRASVQKGEKWALHVYAQITASCNTVVYITGNLAVKIS